VTREELVQAHRAAAAFYRRQLCDRSDTWAAHHLRDRGFGAVLAPDSRWQVGYAPDGWSRLVNHLRKYGFQDEVIVAAGLASVTNNGYLFDRFRDRIVFVAHDRALDPVGFMGRARGTRLRYLNTPNTDLYSKQHTLVGIDGPGERLLDAVPVFVEGPVDAVAVNLLEERWLGAACCGTAITYEQALMVKRQTRTDTVIVALDGGTAGRNGAVRSLDVLSGVFSEVLFARLPEHHDPASLYAAGGQQLRAALSSSRPLVDYAIEMELGRWDRVLDHISGQVNAVRAVAPLVAQLPAQRVAGEIARLARAVRLEEQIVSREVLAAVGPRPAATPRRRRNRLAHRVDVEVEPPDCSRTP
jgi:DNA primase catalytic core